MGDVLHEEGAGVDVAGAGAGAGVRVGVAGRYKLVRKGVNYAIS